ncbi:DUF1801 domain-containing protein [Devosia sp.]|uniref:DUF1801 domain-containing protein n=1 Tax=Devosia sp. TaxID=1871048 RepID=UPI003A8EE538
MAGTTNKIGPTDAEVDAYLDTVTDEKRRADAEQLIEIMSGVTGEPPRMWGDSMIGFGSYHYKYESGREGDAMLTGFAPRKAEFSLYLMGRYLPESQDRAEELLGSLGKHRAGKACLYVKRLSDIDVDKLTELVDMSVEALRERYGA